MGHNSERIYGTHITYSITPFRQRVFVDLQKKGFAQAQRFLLKNWLFLIPVIVPLWVYKYAKAESHRIEKSHWK